jgi:PAS domain S-box-containing protein
VTESSGEKWQHLVEKQAASALRRDLPEDLESLVASERKYRQLVESVNDGIVISQTDHFIFFNRRFAEMLGYTPEELKALSYKDIYTVRGLEILMSRGAARARGQVVSPLYETEFRGKDGRIITVEANVAIIDYEGTLATFAIIRDITIQKRTELVEESLGKMGLALSEATSLERVGSIIRQVTRELFGPDALYVSCRSAGRTRFYAIVRDDLIGGRVAELPARAWDLTPDSFMSNLKSGIPVLINRGFDHESGDGLLTTYGATERKSASLLFAPMHRGESLLGVISVQSYTMLRYDGRDRDLLQRVADLVRPTIERLLAERRSQAFLNLGKELSVATTPEAAARIVVKVADELVGWDASFVDLYYPETGRIEPLTNIDLVDGKKVDVPPAFVSLPVSEANRRLATGPLLVFRDQPPAADIKFEPFGDLSRPSETKMFVPIQGRSGPIGFLSVQSYVPHAYDVEDMQIVQALADHCGGTLERTRAERQLRRSEERYRNVVETVETVILGLLRDHSIAEWNREAARLFGREREEVLGHDFFREFVPAADRVRVTREFEDSLADGALLDHEWPVLSGTGERRVLLWKNAPMEDDADVVVGLLCCGQDVTERKRWEAELQESEARYRAIVEDQTELICRFLPSGQLTFANEAYCEYYGFERDEVERTSVLELIHPSYREAVMTHLANLTREYPYETIEQRVVLATGEVRWQEWTDRAIFSNEGHLIGYQSAGRDITRLREAQEALRRSQERYLRLLESSADVIFQLSTTGEIIFANNAATDVFGVTPSHLMEESGVLSQLVHPDHRARLDEQWETFRTQGRYPQDSEIWKWRRPDGAIVYTENRVSHLWSEDEEVESLLFVLRDVTSRVLLEEERRELESQIQQTQRLEGMSVLAGGIAHDFNNLLTGILGNAVLVLGELDPNSPLVENVSNLQTAALRARDLTKQMLAYAGRGTFVVQPLNLSAVVREMTALLKTVISSQASLNLDLALEIPYVQADATQIRQVVMNIITNASDALEGHPGSISLETGVRRFAHSELSAYLFGNTLEDEDYVYLRIRDTGCGIDAETKKRMFDPFFTKKPTGLVGGRGLGLAAVLGIVRKHSGAIHVDSTVGVGTTFTIVFPQSSFRDAQSPMPVPKRVERAVARHQGLVLVADDEDIVRRVAKASLTKAGYDVIQAVDGQAALEVVEARGKELAAVVLDLRMPRLDGQAACARIRELYPTLPIVLMSGYTEQEMSHKFANRPPTAFVEKPFSASDLPDAVDRLISGRQKEKE